MPALIGTIQVRKDTAANWTANNPILLSGEQGLETDTRLLKIGDGATAWNALLYSFQAYRAELTKTHADGSTIASASTVNIGAAAGDQITISGTTTITAFDTITAGALRRVTFSGALILTHNATSLILPTAANITTAAGDTALFQSLGSGNWRCVVYLRASGKALANPTPTELSLLPGTDVQAYRAELTKTHADGSTIASASTVNIGAAAGDQITISGTTTITAFDTVAAGTLRRLTFSGALILTHNATSLILPTAANITTAAGDTALLQSLGSGNWSCVVYMRASGKALANPTPTELSLLIGTNVQAYRAELTKTHADGSTLASASTVNIGAAAGDQITISGTTTITAFDTVAAGTLRRLTFSGALILTHNATSLILPTAANITTAAGDAAIMQSLGSGNWQCIGYQRADGRPLLLTEVPFIWLRVATTMTNIPAAVTWLSGAGGNIRSSPIGLSNYRQVRLMGYITTAGNSGSKVAVRYRSAYSSVATDYSILGASSTEVAFVLTTGGGIYVDSGWIDITSAAKADVFLALVTKDGDGAADPVVEHVVMHMR